LQSLEFLDKGLRDRSCCGVQLTKSGDIQDHLQDEPVLMSLLLLLWGFDP